MNSENLKVLKSKAKNMTILYIEDSKPLQKQIVVFLSKFFKHVYQAFDGVEGIAQYKVNKPDIVLTDLSMPKLSGIEMIKKLRHIKQNAKIIVLSAHNDENVLMNIIKLNIVDFLMKPLDMDKFITTLLNVLYDEKLTSNQQCEHDLDLIYKQKSTISFVNYFSGFVLVQEGHIISVDSGVFKIKIPHTQILAIDHDQNTVIELKAIKKHMKLHIVEIDKENDFLYLSNPVYTEYIMQHIRNFRYFYNKNLDVELHNKHHYFKFSILDMSMDMIVMYSDDINIDLTVIDTVNFTISLENNEKLYCKGRINETSHYEGGLKITATLVIEKSEKVEFKNYLHIVENKILDNLLNSKS